jgi:phage tail-like protein
MTQTRLNSTLIVELTPMQPPEAEPSIEPAPMAPELKGPEGGVFGALGQQLETATLFQARNANKNLVVYPGEPSEMVVQIHNRGQQTVQIELDVKGDYPRDWCRIRTEGQEIGPGKSIDALLYFQVPQSLFEAPGVYEAQQLALQSQHPAPLPLPTHAFKFGDSEFPGVTPDEFQPSPTASGSVSESQVDQARSSQDHSPNPTHRILPQDLREGYRVLVTVTANGGTAAQQAGQAFQLYVRPRSLYLKFVPGLYREIDFIGRFLKIFEQAFEPVVQSFSYMWANLDPLTAPQALLPFLAHWVASPIDPSWTIDQQRRLIRNAVTLYRWRGTRKGLRLYLHLYTGLPLDEHIAQESQKHISITEPFSRGFVLDQARLDEDAILDGGKPYHFVVRLRSDQDHPLWVEEELIHKMINQQKPAFCTYELHIT